MAIVDDSTTLGATVRAERKRQRLTQEQLATLADVGVRFVRELETGKDTCRIGLALQVMRSLGLSMSVMSRGMPPHEPYPRRLFA